MSDLRSRFEETDTAKYWMHRAIRFDQVHSRYYTTADEYSHYAQIMNAAFMMFEELNK